MLIGWLLQCPPTTWTSSSIQMGIDLALHYYLSSLERGGETVFVPVWEDAMKCIQCFWFGQKILLVISSKASQRYWTHFCACCGSDCHKRGFNSVFLVKSLLNIQIVSVLSYLIQVIFHLKNNTIPKKKKKKKVWVDLFLSAFASSWLWLNS